MSKVKIKNIGKITYSIDFKNFEPLKEIEVEQELADRLIKTYKDNIILISSINNETKVNERELLIEKAKSLGLEFPQNITIKKLVALIEEKEKSL